jgi:hypothetical protein
LQLQTVVSKILTISAKTLHSNQFDAKYLQMEAEFEEVLGEQGNFHFPLLNVSAVVHRSSWREISSLRHYLEAMGEIKRRRLRDVLTDLTNSPKALSDSSDPMLQFTKLVETIQQSPCRHHILDPTKRQTNSILSKPTNS